MSFRHKFSPIRLTKHGHAGWCIKLCSSEDRSALLCMFQKANHKILRETFAFYHYISLEVK